MVEEFGSSIPRNARGSTCTAWCRAAYDRNWTQERVRSTCSRSCAVVGIVNHPIKESRVCQTQVMLVHIKRNGSSMGDDPMFPEHSNHHKSRVICRQMCVQYNRRRQTVDGEVFPVAPTRRIHYLREDRAHNERSKASMFGEPQARHRRVSLSRTRADAHQQAAIVCSANGIIWACLFLLEVEACLDRTPKQRRIWNHIARRVVLPCSWRFVAFVSLATSPFPVTQTRNRVSTSLTVCICPGALATKDLAHTGCGSRLPRIVFFVKFLATAPSHSPQFKKRDAIQYAIATKCSQVQF